MDWCQSPTDWDSAEGPVPSFSKARNLVLSLRKRKGENLLSVQDCCLGIAKRVAGGEGLEGLHRDLYRQHDTSMRVWWNEKQGKGGYGLYGLEWEHDYLGAGRLQGYGCWEVGRGDEVSFNLTLQDPAGMEVDEEVE
jgi:hypothetical protein